MRIVLTGGGTAGHLIPFEPVIEALRTLYFTQRTKLPPGIDPNECRLFFLGIATPETKSFFEHYDVSVTHIPSGKLRRYVSHLTILDLLFRLPLGICKALFAMWRIMPEVVVSKGGYGSIPVVCAAWFFRIPYLVHESDAVVGLANNFAYRHAAAIAVSFASSQQHLAKFSHKIVVTGTPVRSRFGQLSQPEAKQFFGFTADTPVLLVLGGSQGAQAINEIVLQVLPELILEAGIIHLTGKDHYQKLAALAGELLQASSRRDYYKAYPYLQDRIVEAMTAADVVVSRAGATSLAELACLRKPALLVPLPTAANDHQRRNAEEFERAGAARVLDPANLGKNLFKRSIIDLLTNAPLRASLTKNIGQFDHPAAARDLAALVFKLAEGLVPT